MKKKKIANLSGFSLPHSINFFSEGGSVSVDTKDKKGSPQYENSEKSKYSVYKYVKNIPFIRGLSIILDFILKTVEFLLKKKLYLFLAVLVLFYVFFAPEKEIIVVSEPNPFWDNFLDVGFWVFITVFLFCATKNHGAEHKTISAYETTQNLSLKNIKLQPKENRRCGTVLGIWLLPPFIILDILPIEQLPIEHTLLIKLLLFSVIYEVFLLARKRNVIGNITYSPGWLGQKLTTREPDEALLKRARQGIRLLLDKGGYKYKI